MTSIRKESCGRCMIVLFIVMSIVIGCVDQMCQSFLSGCVIFFQPSFLALLLLWIFDLSLPVGDKFFQSLDNGIVSWLLGRDRIFN